jgi:hypothetical protein
MVDFKKLGIVGAGGVQHFRDTKRAESGVLAGLARPGALP